MKIGKLQGEFFKNKFSPYFYPILLRTSNLNITMTYGSLKL